MKRIVALSLILLVSHAAQGMQSFTVNNPRSVYTGATVTNPRLIQGPAKAPTATVTSTTTAAAVAAATAGYDYSAAVAKLKVNVPAIIGSVKVLVPKVQAIVSSASSGSWTAAFSSVVQGALDSGTRDAIMTLVNKIGETIDLVVALKKAPTSAKQDAKGILSAITRDPDVQKLLGIVKGVPFVGTLAHDKLQELINDIISL